MHMRFLEKRGRTVLDENEQTVSDVLQRKLVDLPSNFCYLLSLTEYSRLCLSL